MLLVDAIDFLGLHLGKPALDQDGEFADQSSRTKPFKQDFLSRAFAKASASVVNASLSGVSRRVPSRILVPRFPVAAKQRSMFHI